MTIGTPAAAADPDVAAEQNPADPSAAPPSAEPPVPPSAVEPTADASPAKTSSELDASMRDEHSPDADKGGEEFADQAFGHGMQFGLRAGLVGGYRMVFRYDKSPYCRTPKMVADKDEQKFCGHVAPLAVDVALSFAIADFAEPYAWVRFGLDGEAETNTESLLAFGAGARIYTMSDSKFKIFVEPGLGVEIEKGAGNVDWRFDDQSSPEYKTDFLFHLAVGPQYDFAKAFGVYVAAGLTTGVIRYIHTGLEIGGGVQVRVP
jgi:hypothetical protein